MKRRVVSAVVIAFVAVACGRGGGGVEDPLPVDPGGDPGFVADLAVTVEHPDAETIEYQIVCEGERTSVVGTDLVDAGAACDRLSNPLVQDRLIDGPPAGMACTEIYGGPDVATLVGSIVGVDISATVDRANGCGIGDWDDLLGGVLPPALGVTG